MKIISLFLVSLITVLGLISLPSIAFAADSNISDANTQDAVCEGIGLGNGGSGSCDSGGSTSVNSIIHTVVSILSFVVGIAAIIVIIFGGFRYITSGGDSSKVSTAKSTITYALIGLLIAAFAQVLVRYVFKQAAAPPQTGAGVECRSTGDC